MNYIWSKLSLLEFLEECINKVVKDNDYTFSDLFAWTWIVWRYFKKKWHSIIANDLQYYSYVLNKHYIWNWWKLTFEKLNLWWVEDVCKYLENLKWKEWFIYKNYSLWWTKWQEFERMYFSDENALTCDAIRQQIETWKNNNLITEQEYFFLLCTLLEAIDKVANTASVYGAFLKNLKKSAQKKLEMIPVEIIYWDKEYTVYNEDINELVKHTKHNVVYLDPPYNHRQYSGNYHILETIAKYDNPKISWKTWMRDCSGQKSLYCSRGKVKQTYLELLKSINADYIFLSYNDEGLMSLDDIKEVMSEVWKYSVFSKKYNRFKADKDENREYKKDYVYEYLHCVQINTRQ